MRVKSNIVYELLQDSKSRITVMQGGTRSGKTYNIILFFVIRLLREKGKTFTICRASLPSIRGSVMRDFMEILLQMGIYSEDYHNKTENTYLLNGNLVEFVSVDQPQKVRGRKRNYLFINEANELNYESWIQLAFRTEEKIVLDYNPSDEYHWIYEQVIPRDDCDFYITTYKDNPFIPLELIEEIERLQAADENNWLVYGLGQRGMSKETIYTHWKAAPFPIDCEIIYGLDFGYNVPSALIKIGFKEGGVYVDEMIYETKLTTNDLVERIKEFGITRSSEVFCDSAEPKTIEELVRAKVNAKPASKKSVTEGIRKVKSLPLYITDSSVNIRKEIKSYKWKTDKDGKVLDEPVKFMDHAMDAIRYGVFTKLAVPKREWIAV